MTTSETTEFVPICKVADVRPGEGRQFRPVGGRWRSKPMAIWNDNGTFHATNFICAHMGGPLSEGTLQDGIIECPWHAWRYHVDSGLSEQDDGHAIAVYECRVEGDDVMVGAIKRPA